MYLVACANELVYISHRAVAGDCGSTAVTIPEAKYVEVGAEVAVKRV